MLYLQDELHCHNINLVTPSHFVPQIVQAVLEAVPKGLRLPLVYNTSSYDSLKTLKELDGIISIYLADIRYASNELGRKYSRSRNYVDNARAAIIEMQRQVGDLVVDDEGIAQKGLIVRHLILPNGIAGSEESLSWLVKEVSPRVAVSIMSQYYPAHRACKYGVEPENNPGGIRRKWSTWWRNWASKTAGCRGWSPPRATGLIFPTRNRSPRGGGESGGNDKTPVYCFLLRLVKPKVILRPFSLSFLLTFSMKVLRSLVGLSVLAGLGVIAISLNNFVFQELIIA